MLWLKSCPRCSGDLYEERDMYGPYTDCLQCGYELSAVEEVLLAAGAKLAPLAARTRDAASTARVAVAS